MRKSRSCKSIRLLHNGISLQNSMSQESRGCSCGCPVTKQDTNHQRRPNSRRTHSPLTSHHLHLDLHRLRGLLYQMIPPLTWIQIFRSGYHRICHSRPFLPLTLFPVAIVWGVKTRKCHYLQINFHFHQFQIHQFKHHHYHLQHRNLHLFHHRNHHLQIKIHPRNQFSKLQESQNHNHLQRTMR